MTNNLFMLCRHFFHHASYCTSLLFKHYYTDVRLEAQSLFINFVAQSNTLCSFTYTFCFFFYLGGREICKPVAKLPPTTKQKKSNQHIQNVFSTIVVPNVMDGQAIYSKKPHNNKRKIV